MKLNFDDFVVYKDYVFGFNGPSLACIDLYNGKRMWKGNCYLGWLFLLIEKDLLLVLSKKDEQTLIPVLHQPFSKKLKKKYYLIIF